MKHPTVNVGDDGSDPLSMKVLFTQTINIIPPDSITDRVEADAWFHNDTKMILRDAIDVEQGEVEVLSFDVTL